MTAARERVVLAGDLSDLPEHARGSRNLVWWGNLGFMAIEGTAFVLAAGVYLYLQGHSVEWPPAGDALPGLGWSGAFTIGLLLSALPNVWVKRRAAAQDVRGVRIGIVLMTLAGLLLVAFRWAELGDLGVRWDADAYGSVVWLLMLLPTTHVVTDLGDTVVLGLWLHTHEVGEAQFSDVEDNANYWSFVVLTWLPIYGLVYWLPRLS